METFKIKNSNIIKLLETAPSCVATSAEREKESEQHATIKIRKKGTCHISTGMNKKGFRNSCATTSNTFYKWLTIKEQSTILHICYR